jgi:proline iminopeptidase
MLRTTASLLSGFQKWKLRRIEDYPVLDEGLLPVPGGHQVFFKASGNRRGTPFLFIHGGPGAGSTDRDQLYFNASRDLVVRFDQRGCGQSVPYAGLENNNTWALVDDMEVIRKRLGIERWILFSGSWGTTLAKAYYIKHPDRVISTVLRGDYCGSHDEIVWAYQSGLDRLYPEFWQDYIAPVAPAERGDLVAAYYRLLTSENTQVRLAAAKAWSIWEARTGTLEVDPELVAKFAADDFAVAIARIECHYFKNDSFLREGELTEGIRSMKQHVFCTLVNGDYDMVTPNRMAYQTHKAWPGSERIVVPKAGHSATEPGIRGALVEAVDRHAALSLATNK